LQPIGSAKTVGQEVDLSSAVQVAEFVELPTLPKQVDFLTSLRVPLAMDVTRAPNRSQTTQIKGIAGDGALGTLGALDRITLEILRSLEYGPTLVVWLFDQSGSMQIQREAATTSQARSIVSHTACMAVHSNRRNTTDEVMRAVREA